MKYMYDIIVIGAGSAGLVVASFASSLGARVMLVENRKMGGDCLNYGCVPSKTFLKSTHLAKNMQHGEDYGFAGTNLSISVQDIMKRVAGVIAEIAPHDSKERYESLGVDVHLGTATFKNKNIILLDGLEYSSKSIVIATGSTAFVPNIKGLEDVTYFTNENIFDLDYTPKNMIVLGAGPIGLELGQGFCHLGTNVHVVDRGNRLFSKDEPEVADVMSKVFEKDGLNIHHNSEILEVKKDGKQVIVCILESGQMKELKCDTLLIALGRTPNVKNMGLEDIGIKTNQRGYIIANDKLQTNIPNIFACGDVIGGFMFTHSAGYEATIVVKNALILSMFKINYKNIVWSTYTVPEVAHVGMAESEAKEKGIVYRTILYNISKNDRSKAEDDRDGFVKIILNHKGVVLGGTIVSQKGGELLATLALMVTNNMKLSSAIGVIYPYPTQSEIFKMMALEDLKKTTKAWSLNLLKKIATR